MEVTLVALDELILRQILDRRDDAATVAGVLAGVLPPRHVALRALTQHEQGCPALWCMPMQIVDSRAAEVVGSCSFKGAPLQGRVEIGYAIAPDRRRRGFGRVAVAELLRRAEASAEVSEVIAYVEPSNAPSMALLLTLGFRRGVASVDGNGARVIRWRWKVSG